MSTTTMSSHGTDGTTSSAFPSSSHHVTHTSSDMNMSSMGMGMGPPPAHPPTSSHPSDPSQSASPLTAAALAARHILPQLSIGGSPRSSPHLGNRGLGLTGAGGLGSSKGSISGGHGIGLSNTSSPRRSSLLMTPSSSSRGLKLIDDDDSDEEFTIETRKKKKTSNKARRKHANYVHTFEERWADAKPIEEHGLIGNMRTCALVGTDAQIDWYCYPHFDSPSIFGSILDAGKGGFFSIKAARESDKGPVINRQLYHSETNVLISRFLSDTGVGQVRDFMPVGETCTEYVGWLVRELEVVRGKMYFEVECSPAFNYGRDQHTVEMIPHGARFRSPKLTMILTSARKRVWRTTPRGGVVTKVKLSEGQKAVFTFREDCQYQPEPTSASSTPQQPSRSVNSKIWYNGSNTPINVRPGFAALAGLSSQSSSHGTSQSATNIVDTNSPLSLGASAASIDTDEPNQREKEKASCVEASGTTTTTTATTSSSISGDESSICASQQRAAMVAGVSALNQPLSGSSRHERRGSSSQQFDTSKIPNDGTSPWQGQETATGEGHGPEGLGSQHPSMEITDKLLKDTMSFWRRWISKCTYTGRWREAVYRSALVLKLLTFEPTGAIVAAATTSLPEHVGGHRNWDYRFTWIRDSSFVLYAFLKLGFKQEAVAFMKYVESRCEELKEGQLQIMYGIHGEHQLHEVELDHLTGYMNSHPVRIGNGAFDQIQLDIYGELLDTVYLSNKYAEPISWNLWCHVRRMVDWMCDHWQDQDEGIWEVRSGRQHFVYSKVMCWVCLDRGIRLADHRSFPADVARWRAVRDAIYEEIQERGWNEDRQAFVQHYGSDTLDASVLIMPLVFFMSPTDPRFVKTLDAILASVADDGLVSNNLVFRYNVETTKDGLAGEEGTFSICTFWAVEAAARLGIFVPEYLEKARTMFEQMLGYANHLGLYSEEIGKRGEHLGNFPQAFTHLALISAAVNLDKALSGQH